MEELAIIGNNALQPQISAFSADLFRRFIEYTDREPTTMKGYITCLRQFVKWMKDTGTTSPQRAYKKEFSDLVTKATRQAQQALSPALSVLLEILQDEEQPASARISACRSIAEYGLRLTEITDILKTLEEMDG